MSPTPAQLAEARRELLAASGRMIPKLADAVVGEQMDHVVVTVAVFARTLCDRLGITPERFADMMTTPSN